LSKYPVHPDSAERLYDALPGIKLIYVMRDPIDRIVSQYVHEWSEHTIRENINDAVHEHTRLISYSSYALQLGKYTRYYRQCDILPVFFERLMNEPQVEFERICNHIGYDTTPSWNTDREAQNVSSNRHRWPPALRAALDVPGIRWLRRALLSDSMRTRMKSRWSMKDRPRLSQESLTYLHDQLDPDVKSLGNLLGRKLSCRDFKSAICESSPPEWLSEEGEP
jgi:hypothetical protein